MTLQSADAPAAGACQRGRTPIVVGGTGFYLRWYVHGKPNTPRSSHESATLTEQTLERVRLLPACGLLLIGWLSPESVRLARPLWHRA